MMGVWPHVLVTHQTQEDTEELHHVSVGHRVQPPYQGVEDGDEGGDHH